jgi:CRISPR-associated endonuclease/helicase Cas3
LGKFSEEFQTYLKKASDIHCDEVLEKIDHTTAGAQLAVSKHPLGHCLATAIAGHHAGLLDARHESKACLVRRLTKEIKSVKLAPLEITDFQLSEPPSFITPSSSALTLAFFQRMLFSCLVDADFLATEAFMNEEQSGSRPQVKERIFEDALHLLEVKIASFGTPVDMVNKARATVVEDCLSAANARAGLFSLTVPTGGGKTLSSFAFALKHAIKHGHKRIIYVIPFTSIIEQNAAIFSDLLAELGDDIVLEHHSNLSPKKETTRTRLAVNKSEPFDIGLEHITEIIRDTSSLFASLKRVNVHYRETRDDQTIINELSATEQALCIVNTRKHAQALYQLLPESGENYHLSARMSATKSSTYTQTTHFPPQQ